MEINVKVCILAVCMHVNHIPYVFVTVYWDLFESGLLCIETRYVSEKAYNCSVRELIVSGFILNART